LRRIAVAWDSSNHVEHHPHRAIAERLWNAVADADALALRALLHEKSVWQMRGSSPLSGRYVGPDDVFRFMALVGELSTDLRSSLIDIFVSDRGAVMHYRVRAARGNRALDTEHLLLLEIENGQIVTASFAPLDQAEYDRFFSPP
jgi:ketosteroid isomerase-like protein